MPKPASVTFENKDLGKSKIKKDLRGLNSYAALVGIPSTAPRPVDKKTKKPLAINMASLALIHERGSAANNIPARPFMKQTRQRAEGRFARLLRRLYKQVVDGKVSPFEGLSKLGMAYEGEMKNTFTTGSFTPNKPATIKRKGSSRPLIDTGHLRQSITSKVVKV